MGPIDRFLPAALAAGLSATGCSRDGSGARPSSLPEVVLRVEGEAISRTEIEALASYLALDHPTHATDLLRSTALARSLLPRAIAFATYRDRTEAARERIGRAKARLEAGEAFELVAKDLSDAAPEKGGDAGWITRLDLDPLLGIEAFSAPVGEVRGPIPTPVGFSLIRVSERREDPRPGFSSVRLHQIAAGFEPQPKTLRELGRLLETARIEVLDPPFFDRIRPPGLAFRYAAPASRPSSGS
ncbi:MAG TPA: peptidylprolyl isomerase [Planctomycetota bacterium]|jgi:hypothetical protein|nr:peptidylprolyl isomerase [Planctomycetota bacterium]